MHHIDLHTKLVYRSMIHTDLSVKHNMGHDRTLAEGDKLEWSFPCVYNAC